MRVSISLKAILGILLLMGLYSCAPASSQVSFVDSVDSLKSDDIDENLFYSRGSSNYSHIDKKHEIDAKILKKALTYYDRNKSRFGNQNYISIFDARKKSSEKRLFVVNMKTGSVMKFLVAHGSGSDADNDGFANRFSNRPDSHMTSLGFYSTADIYDGGNGRSLRLIGLESSNSNAYERSVVMHGADYVSESLARKQGRIGRSWGCPAIEMKYNQSLFSMLKNGSLLYVYYNQ